MNAWLFMVSAIAAALILSRLSDATAGKLFAAVRSRRREAQRRDALRRDIADIVPDAGDLPASWQRLAAGRPLPYELQHLTRALKPHELRELVHVLDAQLREFPNQGASHVAR